MSESMLRIGQIAGLRLRRARRRRQDLLRRGRREGTCAAHGGKPDRPLGGLTRGLRCHLALPGPGDRHGEWTGDRRRCGHRLVLRHHPCRKGRDDVPSRAAGRPDGRQNRILPEKALHYLALTGRQIAVEKMTAPARAAGIAKNSPSLRLMKEAINLTEDMPLTKGYRIEQLFTTPASALPDSMAAARSFVEQRQPVWRRKIS